MKKLSFTFSSLMYLMSLGAVLSSAALEAFSQCNQCCVCAMPCKTATFCNTDPISLLPGITTADQPGIPNPSCIKVCGLPKWSVVKGLTVKLENVYYPNANLLSVVLVSPCGDAVVLINSVGMDSASFGSSDTDRVTFCFSDCDGISLSCAQDGPITGTMKVRPTDCDSANLCFTGSNSSLGTKLSATFCKPACGCWKLFTCVKQTTETGLIEGGEIQSWKLIIDHCIPCEKPCVTCNNFNSCDECPKTSNSCTSCPSSCNSCNSSCSSCH